MLVKRLFEKEVPEISQGIVEIKAIARDAGERTKMAVISYNPEVDPIGACIGQRGSRVQEIIEELKGEKIDIFNWSEDFTVLVRNALAPAEILKVLPGEEDRSLTVIVDEDQLSLAIGKKGKNARLAVKLTGRKIDIKTRAELEESGIDYDIFVMEGEARAAEMQAEISRRESERKEALRIEEEQKRQAKLEALARQKADEAAAAAAEEDVLPEEMQEMMSERIRNEIAHETTHEETPAAPVVEEKPEETPEVIDETPEEVIEKPEVVETKPEVDEEETVVAKDTRKKKADLEEVAARNDYVSRFEKLADTTKPKQAAPAKKKRKKGDDDGIKTRNDELLRQLKSQGTDIAKPIYTEEELEEIERQAQEEEDAKYDIDYDDYEEYYEE